ncbi:Rab geranylgeranyltransferase [Geranomyces variabilis]|uniref:Geranylgeranyl transferase type-2 subunit alpha n=1 Tax=Geranomyces variabilis TaxID=109894 RepID=A0AAD5TKS5_9FUNG|nr:Rab geranylgeranyltransferase [Geranomyces variabilis]
MSADQHHQKKVKTTDEEREAQRQRSIKKLAEYKGLCSLVSAKRKAKEYDDAAFNLTTKLLSLNPEFYTGHGCTKLKVLVQAFTDPAERAKVIENEFELVRNAIYTEPADQSAWLYQRWLLRCGGLSRR